LERTMHAFCRAASDGAARTPRVFRSRRARWLALLSLLVATSLTAAPREVRAQTGNGQTIRGVSDPSPVSNIVSSSSGPNPFSGPVINVVVGATRFYDEGYFGFGATVANVEAGHIWNGHESLAHVTTFVQETANPGPQTGEFDRHATWVGAVIGGRPALP